MFGQLLRPPAGFAAKMQCLSCGAKSWLRGWARLRFTRPRQLARVKCQKCGRRRARIYLRPEKP